MRRLSTVALACAALVAATAAQAHSAATDPILTPSPKPGQVFGNVFSISHSIKGDGFDEIVRRNGGAAEYRFDAGDETSLSFQIHVRYDGHPANDAVNKLDRDGKHACFAGDCQTYTDASGLIYNQLLWGPPPAKLTNGEAWTVAIPAPWELGPVADQHVQVVAVDRTAHTATLLREGSGSGPTANDKPKLKITRDGKTYEVDVRPGPARWRGYTTFRDGFVQADELVMERELVLTSPELGELKAAERWLMLLNATPVGG
jgi:hypothetical protein